MTILQLPQGHAREEFAGLRLDEARQFLETWDAEFLEKFPQCKPFHRPSWVVLDVPEACRAPWGNEWYALSPDGFLYLHSADYDSSG